MRGSLVCIAVLLAACAGESEPRWQVAGGNSASGELLVQYYDCGSCHRIPGIRKAKGVMGPPLDGWGQRGMIAGAIPNEPDYLVGWIFNPQTVEPGTAMPNLGMSLAEARDIAAFLYTL